MYSGGRAKLEKNRFLSEVWVERGLTSRSRHTYYRSFWRRSSQPIAWLVQNTHKYIYNYEQHKNINNRSRKLLIYAQTKTNETKLKPGLRNFSPPSHAGNGHAGRSQRNNSRRRGREIKKMGKRREYTTAWLLAFPVSWSSLKCVLMLSFNNSSTSLSCGHQQEYSMIRESTFESNWDIMTGTPTHLRQVWVDI